MNRKKQKTKMKTKTKKLNKCLLLICIVTISPLFADLNTRVELNDDVYQALHQAEMKGFCSSLPYVKPYSKREVIEAIEEILTHANEMKKAEKDYFFRKHEELIRHGKKGLSLHGAYFSSKEGKSSLAIKAFSDTFTSGGLYNKRDFSSFAFESLFYVQMNGSLSKHFSFVMRGGAGVSYVPLKTVSDGNSEYFIGKDWYTGRTKERRIKDVQNYACLPNSYSKKWSGKAYPFSSFNAATLMGETTSPSLVTDWYAGLYFSALDGKVEINFSNDRREWAGMDEGASLALNKNAEPFAAVEARFKFFPFMNLSMLVGVLEAPSQEYITQKSLDILKIKEDAMMFQNAFSISMLELNFKYLHIDMGCTSVWPKRFELGYLNPFFFFLDYQSHIGDYDNLSLFGNIKGKWPKVGEIWMSLYLDEVNNFQNDVTTSSRAMFSGQLGVKSPLPFLPFGEVSAVYTKIEPFCYTHHSINYTPWYSHYINESYKTGQTQLGHYMPPNSDELLIKFSCRPISLLLTDLSYSFSRHGATHGSQQVAGSSIYSELTPNDRNALKKYFTRDGAYSWTHVLSLGVKASFSAKSFPIEVHARAGIFYNSYTMIDGEIYKAVDEMNRNEKATNKVGKTISRHFVDTAEYPTVYGGVLSVGFKISM